jgi:hypothetical protein
MCRPKDDFDSWFHEVQDAALKLGVLPTRVASWHPDRWIVAHKLGFPAEYAAGLAIRCFGDEPDEIF